MAERGIIDAQTIQDPGGASIERGGPMRCNTSQDVGARAVPGTIRALNQEPADRQESTDRLISRLDDPRRSLTPAERRQVIEEIILLNAPVASRIARRFDGRGCSLDDLEQAAYLALVTAAQRFDPTRGHHFMSYVVPCITGELKKHFRDHGWMVRPPRSVQELQARVERERLQPDPTTGVAPSDVDVASRLEVPVQAVRQARAAQGCFTPTSLDRPVQASLDLVLGDLVTDPRAATTYDAAEARAVLEPALAHLAPTERHLLQRRFVDEWTQRDMALELGTTQSSISRMLSQVLERLHEAICGADQDRHEPAA